jgi:hypothetical protein
VEATLQQQAVAARQGLTPKDKARLVSEILALYVRTRRLRAAAPLPECLAQLRLSAREVADEDPRVTHLRAWRLGSAVSRTLRVLPTDSRCLIKSLVLVALLARRGIDSTLVIGVRPGRDFEAHAWVEHLGDPVLPDGGDSYERLGEF